VQPARQGEYRTVGPVVFEYAAAGGWIDADVTVPAGQKPGKAELRVVVTDADNHQGQQKLDYHQRQCMEGVVE